MRSEAAGDRGAARGGDCQTERSGTFRKGRGRLPGPRLPRLQRLCRGGETEERGSKAANEGSPFGRCSREHSANDLGTNSEVRKTFLAGDPDPSRPVPTLCVEPHAREPVTSEYRVPSSPLSASVLAALRLHPTLDLVANPDVSDMLTGRAVASGKRVEWVVASIAAVAADVTGQSLNAGALVQKVRSYVDRSRAPEADKRAGTNAGPTLPPKFNPRIHGSGAA